MVSPAMENLERALTGDSGFLIVPEISRFEVQQGTSVTIAAIEFTSVLGTVTFIGESKMHPNDEFDSQIGMELAFGRMLQKAGDFFVGSGDSRVEIRCADEVGRKRYIVKEGTDGRLDWTK